jgi:hypothetical protein
MSLAHESATWDEVTYLGVGNYLLTKHHWDVTATILHPPLSYYAAAVPLLFFPVRYHRDPGDTLGLFIGKSVLTNERNKDNLLLDLARLPMVFIALLAGLVAYFWGRELYGRQSALLALVFFTFCPNMLAHAHLITPDIAITTFSLLTMFFLWKLLRDPRLIWSTLGGLALGCALLSKFTGALLLPVCVVLIGLWRIRGMKIPWLHCLFFFGLGALAIFVGYQCHPAHYWQGIAYQHAHAAGGHPAFLSGRLSSSGWRRYFITAFILKTPVALLLLLVAATVLVFVNRKNTQWTDVAFLIVPAATVFGFFSVMRQDIGLRYILPVYPFLFIFAAGTAGPLLKKTAGKIAMIVLATWYIAASIFIQPHFLAYFNELCGGPANGYRYLVDSNLDWGQDLINLKRYMCKNNIDTINLSYFGQDLPERYGIAYRWLPSLRLGNAHPERSFVMPRKGWFAISATNLQGVYIDKSIFARFKDHEPVARIGYSIFIYYL